MMAAGRILSVLRMGFLLTFPVIGMIYNLCKNFKFPTCLGSLSKAVMKQQSGKLKRQPGDFRLVFSEENLLIPRLALLRMASLSAYPTDLKINTGLEMRTRASIMHSCRVAIIGFWGEG